MGCIETRVWAFNAVLILWINFNMGCIETNSDEAKARRGE